MRLIYIPLENIEQRYTVMMNNAIRKYADYYLYPDFDFDDKIENGQFLDINKTIIFKSRQLEMIANMFYRKQVKNGDVFLVGDIFFPGIESIRYMAELQGIMVKIYGFNYAGRADFTDFVRKLGKWADTSELGYHLICDGIFAGSRFHAINIYRHFKYLNVKVNGYVWDRDFVRSVYNEKVEKEDYIIFPHRLSPEKGVSDLIRFAKMTEKKIVITSSGYPIDINLPDNVEYRSNLSKKEYYEIMAKAKYYLSTAYQETFGYTLQEAIHFGCSIAVPNRACYPEMVPALCLYDNVEDIQFFQVHDVYTERYNHNIIDMIKIIKDENINSRK